MISSFDIISDFKSSTQIKNSKFNKFNNFLIQNILKAGKEIETFTCERKRSFKTKNPIDSLIESGKLCKESAKVAKLYQKNYNLANLSHHTRPSYDGTGIQSYKFNDNNITDNQIKASKFINDFKNVLRENDFYLDKFHKKKSRNYFEIIENIFEQEKSVNYCCKKLKMSHQTIERKIFEICELIKNFN